MNIGGLGKLQHIPEALESHRHPKDFVHVHERPKRALSPSVDRDVLNKWELKANMEIAAVSVDDVHQHTHTVCWRRGDLLVLCI